MAITLSTAAKNAAVDAVATMLDGGSLVIQDASNATVAQMAFAADAFPAAANGSTSANGLPLQDANAAGGTASKFSARDSANSEVFNGTVTATGGGGDLELSSTTIGAGSTVSITSFDISMP